MIAHDADGCVLELGDIVAHVTQRALCGRVVGVPDPRTAILRVDGRLIALASCALNLIARGELGRAPAGAGAS